MSGIKYKIVRTNRKTVAVVVRDGKVTVRAPLKLSGTKIAEFVASRQNWIEKKIREQTESLDRFSDVKNLKTVLVFGKEKRLVVGCSKCFESDIEVFVKDISYLRKMYESRYATTIFNSVNSLSKIVGATPTALRLGDFKSKWGSCNGDGLIKINWRVLFLPPELQRYIFIHELCHLKHLNHAKEFWDEVGKYCPEYSKIKTELKNYSFLTNLYRK